MPSKVLDRLEAEFTQFFENQIRPLDRREKLSYIGRLRQILERKAQRLIAGIPDRKPSEE